MPAKSEDGKPYAILKQRSRFKYAIWLVNSEGTVLYSIYWLFGKRLAIWRARVELRRHARKVQRLHSDLVVRLKS